MPFTPLHVGPGAAIKAVVPKHFSLTIFCFAQVAIDCETAYYMAQGMYPWHRFLHTYVGAAFVGVFTVIVGRPLCQLALRQWCSWSAAPFKRYFPATPSIPVMSAVSGAFIGTFSHVFLDSIMHRDIAPFMPFSAANPLYHAMGVLPLHLGCIALGLFGAFYIVWTKKDG